MLDRVEGMQIKRRSNVMPKSPKYIRAIEDDVWTDMRVMSVSKKLTNCCAYAILL